MRLIDADALIKNRDIQIVIGAGDNICVDVADIENAPTVDAVEVVRCKDCKNMNEELVVWCYWHERATNPYDYCSYGERRDNGR